MTFGSGNRLDEWHPNGSGVVKSVIEPVGALAQLGQVQDSLAGSEMPNVQLAATLVSAAQKALAESGDIPDMANVRDRLLWGERLLELRGARLIESNLVVAQRLRTERAIGEVLEATITPGRKKSGDSTITLGQMNLSRDESSAFQRIAKIEEHDFETMMQDRMQSGELSTSWAVGLWRQFVAEIDLPEREDAEAKPECSCDCHAAPRCTDCACEPA